MENNTARPTITVDVNTDDVILHFRYTYDEMDSKKVQEVVKSITDILSTDSHGSHEERKTAEEELLPPIESLPVRKKESKKPQEERPIVRDRLPNVIDVNKLDVKRAITENALIRCPNCGQSTSTIIDASDYGPAPALILMGKKIDGSEFKIVDSVYLNDTPKSREDILEGWYNRHESKEKTRDAALQYYNDMVKTMDDPNNIHGQLDVAVEEDTKLICPVCNVAHSFNTWKQAYETPLNWFENLEPCPVCGGEVTENFTEDGASRWVCEECGVDLTGKSFKVRLEES